MTPRDLALWNAARPWLDVRSNDVHTLIAWRLAGTLLTMRPGAAEAVVLPAIILHDTGWKQMPQEKLALAVGPNAQFPELQRDHELAGVEIGRDILVTLALGLDDAAILAIIDGHDTTKAARSGIASSCTCSVSACAPAPTAPRPSSVRTPTAAVRLPSLPPPTATPRKPVMP